MALMLLSTFFLHQFLFLLSDQGQVMVSKKLHRHSDRHLVCFVSYYPVHALHFCWSPLMWDRYVLLDPLHLKESVLYLGSLHSWLLATDSHMIQDLLPSMKVPSTCWPVTARVHWRIHMHNRSMIFITFVLLKKNGWNP